MIVIPKINLAIEQCLAAECRPTELLLNHYARYRLEEETYRSSNWDAAMRKSGEYRGMKIVVELSYAEMPADAVLETGAAEILAESTDPTVCVAGHDRRGRWRYFGDGVEEPKTAALQKRIAELEAQVYVPGLWRCAKCSFQLMQATLCASTGNVASRNEPGEKCPNCDVPLWRVTERQAGNEMVDRAEDAFTRLAAVEAERKEALEVMSLRWPPGYSMPQEEKLPAIVRALFDATASRVAELRKDPA